MARAGRRSAVVELSETEYETLSRWARRHSTAQSLSLWVPELIRPVFSGAACWPVKPHWGLVAESGWRADFFRVTVHAVLLT